MLLGKAPSDVCLAPLEMDQSQAGPAASRSDRRASDKGCLPISVADYLNLVDWTGRQIVRGKRGSIPVELASILDRLGIAEGHWLPVITNFGRYFHRVAGAARAVGRERPRLNRQRTFHPGRADLLGAA
jgi:hypothetical protein